jgi:hypothetical protein
MLLKKDFFSVNIDTASYCPVSLQRGGQSQALTQPLRVQSAAIFSYLLVLIRKMLLKKDPFQLILIQPLIVQSASSEEDSLRHTQSTSMSCQPPVFSYLQVLIRKMLLKKDPFQLVLIQPLIVQSASSEEDSLRHTHSPLHVMLASIFSTYAF